MVTECNTRSFDFQPLAGRQVTALFDGGAITSDAGALLLREVEQGSGILRRFAECFDDFRDPDSIEFSVEQLLKQRLFALCLGYEDLNDHDQLRHDPLLAVLAGRADPTGQDRIDPRDRGVPLAGKSTLNRLELTPPRATAKSRYKKVAARHGRIDRFFVDTFLDLTSGTLLGLNYTLSLPVASGTGNGLQQTYTVNGSIAGGQAGTCATANCGGYQTRTLTVTY